MSGESPASILFSSDGVELTAVSGSAIPTGTRGIISAGSDGTNARFISVDSSGRTISVGAGVAGTPTGGVLSIQGVASGTPMPISGTVTASNASITTTGSAVPASATFIGASVTTAAPTYTTGNLGALSLTTSGFLRVDGSGVTQPVSGTGTFTVVQSTAANLLATVTASGNFNNASVSATGAAPPASGTYIAGSVTTAAPTYTTGQASALSLTTAGSLRVDGSGVTQPVSGSLTANIGTTGGLALDATLTGGTATSRITDGTNTATVKAASTAPVAADKALVVAISPNSAITVTTNKSATSAVTSVAASTTTATMLASNANRVLASFFNATNKICFIKFAATASLTSYSIQLFPNSYMEVPSDYTGICDFIQPAGATGNILVTEYTP